MKTEFESKSECPICHAQIEESELDQHLHIIHHYSSMNLAHLQSDWTARATTYKDYEDPLIFNTDGRKKKP
jgi:hypothetical protein